MAIFSSGSLTYLSPLTDTPPPFTTTHLVHYFPWTHFLSLITFLFPTCSARSLRPVLYSSELRSTTCPPVLTTNNGYLWVWVWCKIYCILDFDIHYSGHRQKWRPVSPIHLWTKHSTCLASIPAPQFPILLSVNIARVTLWLNQSGGPSRVRLVGPRCQDKP